MKGQPAERAGSQNSRFNEDFVQKYMNQHNGSANPQKKNALQNRDAMIRLGVLVHPSEQRNGL